MTYELPRARFAPPRPIITHTQAGEAIDRARDIPPLDAEPPSRLPEMACWEPNDRATNRIVLVCFGVAFVALCALWWLT